MCCNSAAPELQKVFPRATDRMYICGHVRLGTVPYVRWESSAGRGADLQYNREG
ncbi:hypothetical protein BRYFOR_05297 [Marvinbryantia formatexigens DSM 14469]|uniref:Uncharacterized protein n=1 Tax=Marvinbryantia formatexigens DSM 14469 TaxID=478749 RepID=C6L9K8_9FIRM|nr:hypothetical protein BRYFOR_05297 [Marvinbryantia formatexigens DSM 14469]